MKLNLDDTQRQALAFSIVEFIDITLQLDTDKEYTKKRKIKELEQLNNILKKLSRDEIIKFTKKDLYWIKESLFILLELDSIKTPAKHFNFLHCFYYTKLNV